MTKTLPPDADPNERAQSAMAIGLRLGALFGPVTLGVTAAGVALPSAAAALDVGPDTATWVLTAHALAVGLGTALAGRLFDTWGARATLLASLLLLGAGAAVVLAAPSFGVLVAGRFALGAGSGAAGAVALTLAAHVDPAQRPKVLAWFGATMAAIAGSATLVGGVVTEALSWHITLALPAVALAAVPFVLGLTSPHAGSRRRVDALGAALLTTTATALLVLIQAPALDLPLPLVVAVAAVLTVAAGSLAMRVRRRPDGFVPRALASNRAFGAAAATGFGVYGGFFAALYAVPQILVGVHGWSVLAVGAALLPGAALGASLSRVAGRIAARIGGQPLLASVAVAGAAGLIVAGLTGGVPLAVVIAASIGFAAFAITQVVLTAEVSTRTAAAQRGAAMGLLNLAFLTGGAVGSAAVGALAGPLDLFDGLALVGLLPLAAGAVALARLSRRAPAPALAARPDSGT